jgi:predicted nucleic acid-binding protein
MPERPVSIEVVLTQHQRVAIDSNVLIYLLGDDPERAEVSAAIVDAVAAGMVEGVLATVGLAEVLVGPARQDDGALFEQTAATIRDLGFHIVPMDAAAAEDAAWIRGRTGLSLPDAAHLACAKLAGATAFITNDREIGGVPGLVVLRVDDLGTQPDVSS